MLRAELLRFLFVGLSTVAIDFLAYISFLLMDADPTLAKLSSFLLGTVFAFFANKNWTFNVKKTSLTIAIPFILLYSISMACNTMINDTLLSFFENSRLSLFIAFVVATGFSAALNFLGMKFFIFKKGESHA